MPHNPEVAGSNPAPATRQNGPEASFRAVFCPFCGAVLTRSLTITPPVDVRAATLRPRRYDPQLAHPLVTDPKASVIRS
jgi:hypothetical protein